MNEHEHGPDCGCDHEEEMTVTLSMDDGTELECEVISIFPVNEKDYIALSPINNVEEDEIILFRFNQLENDEAEIINIDDDDEYDAVFDAFEELIDESEWDDIIEDNEV